jgi:hypothetical protein
LTTFSFSFAERREHRKRRAEEGFPLSLLDSFLDAFDLVNVLKTLSLNLK